MVLRSQSVGEQDVADQQGAFCVRGFNDRLYGGLFYNVNINIQIEAIVVSCIFSTRVKSWGIASAFLPETARNLYKSYAKTYKHKGKR